MPRQRPTTNVLPDSSLPHAIYWGSESGYGGIYQILGKDKKGQVLIKRVYDIFVESSCESINNHPFLNDWPIKIRVGVIIEFKYSECLQNFLLNPKTAFGPDGSDSEPGIDSVASNA